MNLSLTLEFSPSMHFIEDKRYKRINIALYYKTDQEIRMYKT